MNKLFLVGLMALLPFSLATADIKVAVVDLSKAFEQYYKTQQAQARLKEKQTGYEKEIQELVADYQHMGQEAETLDKAANDQTLSAAARQDKSTALTAKKQDLVNLGNKIQEMKVERSREMQDELLRRHKEIVDEISKIINDYSGPQGYDLVIDKSPAATGVSPILYNSTKLTDITADIVAILNKNAPPAGSAPAAPTGVTPSPAAPATTHH